MNVSSFLLLFNFRSTKNLGDLKVTCEYKFMSLVKVIYAEIFLMPYCFKIINRAKIWKSRRENYVSYIERFIKIDPGISKNIFINLLRKQ